MAPRKAQGRSARCRPPAPDLALPAWESVEDQSAARGVIPEARALRKPTVPYVPPKGVTLKPVSGTMTLTCHTSPDAGWTTLGPFLAGVKKNLTVAMYDFTAPHILKGLTADMKKAKGVLKLNLDPGIALSAGGGDESDNPKAHDITEDKIRDDLTKALGKRFDFTWAAVKRAGKTTGGIFPSAYHIKVAVRDSSAFWLSSGNWQSSNQPDIKKPNDAAAIKKVFATYNREWHVLVQNAQLAKVYEAYIDSDIKETTPLQDTSTERAIEAMQPDLLVPIDTLDAVARGALQFFEPQEFKFGAGKKVTIQPVLTPDNYADVVLKLIESAKKTLYFQNQYIHINKQNADGFMKLVKALLQKIEDGLDVRIILRSIGDTRAMLEALQAQGFPPETIRLQANCHNKGIIVDGKVVAVGSHNWSSDGTTANRDATLVIQSPDVAAFYQKVFLFDWANLAHQKVATQRQVQIAPRGLKTTPKGMMRVPWSSYFEE